MSLVQPAERVYEEFEPPHDWVHDEASDTLILMLPGYRKEQLRVQIASTRILRLSGERQISGNKWRQFRKEFPIPQESDTNGVSAKFENGILYIKLPKLITPIKPTPPTQQQASSKPPNKLPTQEETPKPPQQPTPPNNAQEANKTEKTSKPPTPTPIAPQKEPKVDEESQIKKPKPVDKAVEAKAEKAKEAPPAPEAQAQLVAPLLFQEQKNEVDDSQEKAQKEKEKSEATTSKAHHHHHHHEGVHEAKVDKRSQTLELLSRQTQEYKSAVYGLVEELKKQKKLVNLLVGIFLAFVFGLYVKHAIKSSFEGPKIEEL